MTEHRGKSGICLSAPHVGSGGGTAGLGRWLGLSLVAILSCGEPGAEHRSAAAGSETPGLSAEGVRLYLDGPTGVSISGRDMTLSPDAHVAWLRGEVSVRIARGIRVRAEALRVDIPGQTVVLDGAVTARFPLQWGAAP